MVVIPQNDGVYGVRLSPAPNDHRRTTTMNHYAGIDVSQEESHICVVDEGGKILKEGKVLSEPAALIAWFSDFAERLSRQKAAPRA
jgi:hypothetical protein